MNTAILHQFIHRCFQYVNKKKQTFLMRFYNVCAATDIALGSIKKLLIIAKEAMMYPETRSMIEARYVSLKKFATEFDKEQNHSLSILVEHN